MLADEGFEDVQNLFLLTPRHLGDGFKKLAGASARRDNALGARLAQQFLDGDAQRLGHRREHIRTRNLPAALPIADVGVRLADLLGEFTH